jgi:hypothetical protein
MKSHWLYLRYVLRHKWYVFLWCCRYGIPWAGIVHDLSKFQTIEWFPYVDKFYGGPYPEKNYGDIRMQFDDMYTQPWVDRRFNEAWNHHQKANPHHWQYWLLTEDSGATIPLEMPDRYRREMLADWRGAGMAIKGKDETTQWYTKNYTKMQLHPYTRRWVEQQLGLMVNVNGEDVRLLNLLEDA